MVRLSRYEQETIITFNAGEKTANIYSSDPVWAKKIQKIKGSRKYSVGYEVDVPKNWIKVAPPRQYSEETKKKMAENLRKARQKKSSSSNTNKKTTKKAK